MRQQSNYGYNRNNQNHQNERKNTEWSGLKKPDRPLSEYYADKEGLLLPDGYAYVVAEKFKYIPSHQLRKILSQVKIAKTEAEAEHFKEAKNKLFSLLPLAAYNVGRTKGLEKQNMRNLYDFLKENLKPQTLQSKEDIFAFDELFTSIIAYHKYLGGK